MGNDIITVFMDRKRTIINRFSLLFVKYLVDEKVKLNKTVDNMLSIYFRDFYLEDDLNFDELEKYFAVQRFKDVLLKKSLLSAIRFYKENGLEDKIETDIRTIALISNAFYLSLSLEIGLEKNYDKDSQEWFKLFLKKYQNKIRITDESKLEEFSNELLIVIKREESCYKKFFKLLEDKEFDVELQPLLDYRNGYLVKGNYDIKMLSRYSKKEIVQVYESKGFYLEHFLVTLERLENLFLRQVIKEKEIPKYFIVMPIDILLKDKYKQMFNSIITNTYFRSSLVFVFVHTDLISNENSIQELYQDGLSLGLMNLSEDKITPSNFQYVNYVFTSPTFLENHSKYYSLWEDKDIRFIVWEENLS